MVIDRNVIVDELGNQESQCSHDMRLEPVQELISVRRPLLKEI